MSEPVSIRRALEDVSVAGRTCLEAGAGAGATSAYLANHGAAAVYAVTRDRDHATDAREYAADARAGDTDRVVSLLQADLQSVPLPEAAVDLVTAHALVNVVPPSDLGGIVTELARVARPDGELVVVDYTPLGWIDDDPDGTVQRLFAVENAASYLADGRPMLVFYPPAHVRALLASVGWTHVETTLVTTEVPWGRELLSAHADVVASLADRIDDPPGSVLVDRARSLVDGVDQGEVRHAGGMYAARFERS